MKVQLCFFAAASKIGTTFRRQKRMRGSGAENGPTKTIPRKGSSFKLKRIESRESAISPGSNILLFLPSATIIPAAIILRSSIGDIKRVGWYSISGRGGNNLVVLSALFLIMILSPRLFRNGAGALIVSKLQHDGIRLQFLACSQNLRS